MTEDRTIIAGMTGRAIDGGKYIVGRLVGQGAMGEVYAAQHVQLDRKVAIKFLRADRLTRENAEVRFRREALAASRIDHPNSLRILDFGKDEQYFYLVMEFVEGVTLGALLYGGKSMAPPRVVALLTQVLGALASAHDADIVHRDLKPDNIMLSVAKDEAGHPVEFAKVCDFGVAKLAAGSATNSITHSGGIAGTPLYMSPEQIQNLPVGPATDLYALGVIAYSMLTGAPPFGATETMALLYQHVNELPVDPSARFPDLPKALVKVVMKALSKDPKDRYQDARAMRSAISSSLDEGQVAAAPYNDNLWDGARWVTLATPHSGTSPSDSHDGLRASDMFFDVTLDDPIPANLTRRLSQAAREHDMGLHTLDEEGPLPDLLAPPAPQSPEQGATSDDAPKPGPARRRWLAPVALLIAGAVGGYALSLRAPAPDDLRRGTRPPPAQETAEAAQPTPAAEAARPVAMAPADAERRDESADATATTASSQDTREATADAGLAPRDVAAEDAQDLETGDVAADSRVTTADAEVSDAASADGATHEEVSDKARKPKKSRRTSKNKPREQARPGRPAKPAAGRPATKAPAATEAAPKTPQTETTQGSVPTEPTTTKPTTTKPTATKPTATKPTATKPTATKPRPPTQPLAVKPPPKPKRLALRHLKSQGPLSPRRVKGLVQGVPDKVTTCLKSRGVALQSFYGQVSKVRFIINEFGHVAKLQVTGANGGLRECITSHCKTLVSRVRPDLGVVRVAFSLRWVED